MMRKQFSFADVWFGCVIAAAMLSLLSMSVVRLRTAARAESCANHFKVLGLATHNYHSAFNQLPYGAGGTDSGGQDNPMAGNAGRLSAFVALLPFMEQQPIWEIVANPFRNGSGTFPAMGPVPWHDPDSYPPWSARPDMLVCPDDAGAQAFPIATSYVVNYGDGIEQVGSGRSDWPNSSDGRAHESQRAVCRGVFAKQVKYKFRDILDGLSNTMMMSEMQIQGSKVARGVSGLASNPSLAIAAQGGDDFWPAGRLSAWCDGSLRSSGFQSILPPGSPSATSDIGETTAVMSASSYHGDGANVLMADGSVIYVSSSIDAGDPESPSVMLPDPEDLHLHAKPGAPSPYGLWGAIGTRAGKEVITEQLGKSESTEAARERAAASVLAELQKRPLETLLTADRKTEMTGWVLSCSPQGKVVFVASDGKQSTFKLSDLDSETAYDMVAKIAERKIVARKVLLPQLNEALELLEDKEIDTFVERYIDREQLAKMPKPSLLVKEIRESRGAAIQIFDEMIAVVESVPQQVSIDANDEGEMVVKFQPRGNRSFKGMFFRDGRWYWIIR